MKKLKERTREEKAYAVFRCRSFDLLPIRRLSLDPSSSTFYFFNGVFENEREIFHEFSPEQG